MSSLLNDLESLINPAPLPNIDASDDECDVTSAKVVDKYTEETNDSDDVDGRNVVKRTTFLDEENPRYLGAAISRSQLSEDEDDVEEFDESDDYAAAQVDVLESDVATEDEDNGDDGQMEGVEETESTDLVRPFSFVDLNEEVLKGKAVQSQLQLWDQLLAARIRLQRILNIVNQLPQNETTWLQFSNANEAEANKLISCKRHLKSILDNLLKFQNELLNKNATTKFLVDDNAKPAVDDDEEIESSADEAEKEEESPAEDATRKLLHKMSEYPKVLSERYAAFKQFQDKILLHSFEKTRLASGKIGGKNDFAALEKNILSQIEQILSDKNRLIKRTQLKRSSYSILGKRKASNNVDGGDEDEQEEWDEEIFDDDDFYHQILRELIERKSINTSDPHAMSRQWLEMQKLRNKAKKKHVDRKASKGRKVRYDVLSKLVNFMPPVDRSSMSDEAKNELYKSLFGKRSID